MKATLLTKPNCPHCQALKMFLKHAMNDAYANDIEILDLENHQTEVENLLKKHNIQSFPSMIANDDVMVGFLPSKLMSFLEKHIGKK
jgi:glutaredoxin-like protein NrdH